MIDLTMLGCPKPRKEFPKGKNLLLLWKQRKYNGCMVFGVSPGEIFSRRTSKITKRKISYTEKLPLISEEFKHINLPKDSVLLGEMVYFPGSPSEPEDFTLLQRITGSGTGNSLRLQEKYGHPKWMVYDILFLKGKEITSLPYRERYGILQGIPWTEHISLVENLALQVPDMEFVKSMGWEGLVLKDPDGLSAVEYNDIWNNNPRPASAWKFKPKHDIEVLIWGFEYGQGKYENQAGKLKMFSPQGKYLGKVGVFRNYSEDIRETLVNIPHKYNGEYYEPLMAKVEYESMTHHGILRAPVLVYLDFKKCIK